MQPTPTVDELGLKMSGLLRVVCGPVGKVLGRQPGVTDARLNLATRRASVVFDP